MSLRLSLASALLAAALLAPAWAAASGGPPLVDQTGRSFTLESLRGRPLIVTFVSAHCHDACPLVNGQFAEAAATIEQQHLTTRLVTITLDPKNDPPSVMRALAARFDADARYWRVASGQPNDVDAILHAFGVVAKLGKSGYREAHSTFVYVFDSQGKLDKTMLASTGLTDDILTAARTLQHGSAK